MKRVTLFLMATLLAATSVTALAQDRPAAATTEALLKVQVVMTRYDGDKKVTSLPYTILVNAAEAGADPARVIPKYTMMGVQVPLQVTVRETPTVTFKDVGTDIKSSAIAVGVGRYRVRLDMEQSFVADPQPRRSAESVITGPVLRTFRDSVDIVLRDGQTTQTSSAADPVTGEVLKVDVTLTVVK